jgi:lipoprotein-releasing system permease protein
MQLGYHIAKKLSFNTQHSFTKTITSLAIAAVSISICVVILAFGILLGFKKEIREKIKGYAGDISISRYQLASGSETNLFDIDYEMIRKIEEEEHVSSIFPFINKAGILKSDTTLEGIILKGLPANYDYSFYQKHLVRGKIPHYTDTTDSYDILLSEYTASILNLDTGDRVNLYFIDQSNVRRRMPLISGIFNTGLQEFDKQFAIAHLRSIQRVVSKDYSKAAGYEINVDQAEHVITIQNKLQNYLDYTYAINTAQDLYPAMFQWLDIVDTNVLVIIILMFIVAIINIITILLILIIERIPMIGILKSMGAQSSKIGNIFNWQGAFILTAGLLIGNGVALGFASIQNKYSIIKLNAETYYMDAVPFYLPWDYLLYINLGALFACFVFTYIPVRIIHRIHPAQSIRFS